MVKENSVSFSGLEIRGKGRTGWRKTRFIIFASLNSQPQNSKVYKKVAREGKRGTTCWWNGWKDQKISERMPNPPVMEEEGAGGWVACEESREEKTRRMAEGEIKQGGRSRRLSWESVPGQRDRRWISAIRKSCGNPAGWDVLPKECSAVVLFTLLQPDKLQLYSLTHSIHS